MSQLVTMHDNQPTVSHRVIAENTGNNQVSISNTINKYILDFEEFGKVHFKNEAIKNSKNKVNEVKTFLLNEQQATLLLTYLKNSSAVRTFKVALVKEFYKLREELYQKPKEITPIAPDLLTVLTLQNDLRKTKGLLTKEKNKHAKSIEAYESKIETLKQEQQSLKKVGEEYDVGLVDALTANLIEVYRDLTPEHSKKLFKYALDLDAGEYEEPSKMFKQGFMGFMYHAHMMKDDLQNLMRELEQDYPFTPLELRQRHDELTKYLHQMGDAYAHIEVIPGNFAHPRLYQLEEEYCNSH